MNDANNRLLKAIQARTQKQTSFGYGIQTADRYVRTMEERVGLETCYNVGSTRSASWHDAITKAASTLTYTNDDMVLDHVQYQKAKVEIKQLDDGTELPPNTLMAFQHILTTPKKDRDGDILRTQGAEVDENMLLLWQHVHTLPIGKVLRVVEQTKDVLKLVSVIVDMNELSHDAAVMIDNKMGRFSHGFRAIEFEEMEAEKGEFPGFDIKRFEIMEASLVSVPSNIDAQTEDVMLSLLDGGKLHSPLMKEYGKTLRQKKPLTIPIKIEITEDSKRLLEKATSLVEEIENENKSRTREEKAGEGISNSPSKETDENGTEEKDSQVPKVKFYGTLENSWEQIEHLLLQQTRSFLSENGISTDEHDWVWLAGTFSDHAIIAVEKQDEKEELYYECKWNSINGAPTFIETPKKVKITIDVTVQERSSAYKIKSEKRGRSLSKANEASIKDAVETIEEVANMDIPKLAKVGLREATNSLKGILDTSEIDEEASTETITVKDATGVFMTCANKAQRETMLKFLMTEYKNDRDNELLKQFNTLKGIN